MFASDGQRGTQVEPWDADGTVCDGGDLERGPVAFASDTAQLGISAPRVDPGDDPSPSLVPRSGCASRPNSPAVNPRLPSPQPALRPLVGSLHG